MHTEREYFENITKTIEKLGNHHEHLTMQGLVHDTRVAQHVIEEEITLLNQILDDVRDRFESFDAISVDPQQWRDIVEKLEDIERLGWELKETRRRFLDPHSPTGVDNKVEDWQHLFEDDKKVMLSGKALLEEVLPWAE